MTLRSLHIGINNYPGTGSNLNGCINDAHDWENALAYLGFTTRNLLDLDATRDRMIQAIGELVASAGPGDTAVLTYSGHGTWTADLNGDEADQRDEALCPSDLMEVGPLLDDDLYWLFTGAQDGAKIVFVSDSCHSGTVTRFMPALNPLGIREFRRVRFLPPEVWLPAHQTETARALDGHTTQAGSRTTALLISGCRDTEYSYDAWFAGRPNGAFTYQALRALADWSTQTPTYLQWWRSIRGGLPSIDYPQAPQLYGTATQKAWPAFR